MLAAITGVVLFVVGPSTAATIGAVVALVAIALIIGDQLPSRDGTPSRLLDVRDPKPQYVEKTQPASEEAWEREQELYRQRRD